MILLLDLPKPVHGMSAVNKSVVDRLDVKGVDSHVINTVPSYFSSFFGGRLWGGIKLLHTIYCACMLSINLCCRSRGTVYRPLNGGFGQFYDLIYAAICRGVGATLYVHHHSFNYLNSRSTLFCVLNYILGADSRHVVLGERMRDLLVELYGIDKSRIIILSNVAFFDEAREIIDVNDTKPYLTIGHLSNLCVAKGVDDFVLLCRELKRRGVSFKAKLAGPFADDQAEAIVLDACADLDEVEYLGSLYNEKKRLFFNSLDVFVFPSKYKNEAEPLVLYEAAQHGVMIFGTRRGCMESVVNQLAGVSIEEGPMVVQKMADALLQEIESNSFSFKARADRVDCFVAAQKFAMLTLTELLFDLENNNVSEA